MFNTSQWRHYLKGAVGLVSCLGGFGSNEAMLKVRTHCCTVPAQALCRLCHCLPRELVML